MLGAKQTKDTGPITAADVAKALRARGAGDPKWDWLSQEAAIMLEKLEDGLEQIVANRDNKNWRKPEMVACAEDALGRKPL